jgi:hypothetical protein
VNACALVVIILFALASSACHNPAEGKHLSGALLADQRATAAPQPKVSAEFQSEVSQLAAEGLHLKEALEASLDGSSRHLAAVFDRPKPRQPNEAFEFRIIESDGRATKTIFRRAEFFFTFAAGEVARLNGTDINGDGAKEVIVQSSSGGNCWGCNPTEVYTVRNHKAELIAAGPVQKIADLNQDGIAELLVTDARWEVYDDLSHAASPSAVMVYAWRGGRYVYASSDFAPFYRNELEQLRAAINEAKGQITEEEFSDELYVGRAMALAITSAHMGELERGLKEMEAILNSNARTAAQAKHRASIIEDFRRGDSSKKLRQMKPGDPMPI